MNNVSLTTVIKIFIKITHFWDHSRFMPDVWEKAVSISCWCAVRVGTGLEEGVGAGATKARRISSVVAILMKSWSFTIHRLERNNKIYQFQVNKPCYCSIVCISPLSLPLKKMVNRSWTETIDRSFTYPVFPAGTVIKTREKAMVDSRDLPSTATEIPWQISKNHDFIIFISGLSNHNK